MDVEIHMGERATVEAVFGQVQLRRTASQPHIQRPVWPEDVLRREPASRQIGARSSGRRSRTSPDAAS